MRLLHWSILKPVGDNKLAVIAFKVPVRVSFIRLFPNGVKPFENVPNVVAETKPESFALELFFVASPDRTKPPSVVPTRLAYPGGLVDYDLETNDEVPMRVMIVKGDFEVLSIAIYGEPFTTPPSDEHAKGPQALPTCELTPLGKPTDPANSQDPTSLAKQLLTLLPNPPSLPVATRLVFCLKSSAEEWASPEFPNLHADIDTVNEEDDLEDIVQMMTHPISDDTTEDAIEEFAHKISRCPPENDHAFHIANLLSISASQHPALTRTLLRKLDLWSIFTADNLDEGTLLGLLDAATNVDVSRHLNNESFLDILREVEGNYKVEKSAQVAAGRLITRVRQWHAFEDALTNKQADFEEAFGLLREIAKEEQALGIWLESMITHDDVLSKLQEVPISTYPQNLQVLQFHDRRISVSSHEEFVSLVRAYIGVSAVMVVWGWADELDHDVCRERVLGILHLWQGIDGYEEIVNYLLLQRQAIRRLKWIISDSPTLCNSGILSENILLQLCNDDPRAMLNEDVMDAVLKFEGPLSFITDAELQTLHKIVYVAEDGLPAAVDELLYKSDRPISTRRLRILRAALAIVERELDEPNGLWRTMEAFLEVEQGHTLTVATCLVEFLTEVGEDLSGHFSLAPIPKMNQALADLLFRTAGDIIGILKTVLTSVLEEASATLPLPSRGLQTLITAVMDVFSATESAGTTFSKTSPASASAGKTRQACLDLTKMLCEPSVYVDAGSRKIMGAKVVLRTLLGCATHEAGWERYGFGSGEVATVDPVIHLQQVSAMIDHVLSEPTPSEDGIGRGEADVVSEEDVGAVVKEPSFWVATVFPDLLDDIKPFFAILTPQNKCQFLAHLIDQDQPNRITGIGEWLLTEDIKQLQAALHSFLAPGASEAVGAARQYHASLCFQFLAELIAPASGLEKWFTASLTAAPDLAYALGACLFAVIEVNCYSPELERLVLHLMPHARSSSPELVPDLRLALILNNLHIQQSPPAEVLKDAIAVLDSLPDSVITIHTEFIRYGVGRTLATYLGGSKTTTAETDRAVFNLLSWLARQSNPTITTLVGISSYAFQSLCALISPSLSDNERVAFISLRPKFTIGTEGAYPATQLPSSLSLPLQQIQNMLAGCDEQKSSTPSTPPREKAGTKTPDVLGVIISPQTALLRSNPTATTGLTKTYLNNDFRQLRQAPSARQNTSRLPSMHVDDFQVQDTVVPVLGLPLATGVEMLVYPPIMDMEQL